MVFSTYRAVAISAPVLPALTQASASPLLTRLMLTRIEESFLPRSADCGCSSMPTTSVAGWMRKCTPAWTPRARNSVSMASGIPTRTMVSSGLCFRYSKAAGTVTVVPWSPPIASIANVTSTKRSWGNENWERKRKRSRPWRSAALRNRLLALGLDYLFATVKAGRADMVTQMSLARRWLDRRRRVGQKIVGTVHTALGRGLFILLNCHDDYS